jgi:hypothetical protein
MKTFALDYRQLKFQFNLPKWELEAHISLPRDIKVKNMRFGSYFQVYYYWNYTVTKYDFDEKVILP